MIPNKEAFDSLTEKAITAVELAKTTPGTTDADFVNKCNAISRNREADIQAKARKLTRQILQTEDGPRSGQALPLPVSSSSAL